MKLSSEVQALRARFYATFPIPTLQTGEGQAAYEQRVREYSIRFAQQIAFSRPGEGYGMKRGDRTRPIGKDSLARRVGETILSWDLFLGTGTGRPSPAMDPDAEDVSDQFFEAVTPVDLLGDVPPGAVVVPPVTGTPPTSGDVGQVVAHFEDLLKQHEDASERRYRDLIAHFDELKAILQLMPIPTGFDGSIDLGRFLGTAQIHLEPRGGA